MNKITSLNNNLIKDIVKLRQKKYRNKSQKFIIETKKLINEAIQSNYEIENIFIRESENFEYKNSILLSKNLFDKISSLKTPDGYLAIVKKKQNKILSEKILILDNIQDPGNLGTLIRSCEAFGFNTIISINSVDFYNEKVLRATMGSLFRLNLIESNYDFIEKLKEYTILVADMSGDIYTDIKINGNIALVIGNEGNGISEQILKFKHKKIKIDMQGQIESLNAAVSGSIIMAYFSK